MTRLLIPTLAATVAALSLTACSKATGDGGGEADQRPAEPAAVTSADGATSAAGDTTTGQSDAHTSTSAASTGLAGGASGQTPAYGQPGGVGSAVQSQPDGGASEGNDNRPGQ